MKILFSGFRDSLHSSAGGYDKITGMPGDVSILLGNSYPFGSHFGSHVIRIPLTMLDIHTRFVCRKYDITHLFYGEMTVIPVAYPKSRKSKTVITLHLNVDEKPSWFKKMLPGFDGIVVLSTQQQRRLKEKYGLESVFIPHGLDKPEFEYVMPKSETGAEFNRGAVNVAMIGNNYRDFRLLERVVDFVEKNGRDILFHIVGMPADEKKIFRKYKSVRVYGRLDNDEYFTLLSECDYNFMPLKFATANNTLLEAQSLGISSILPAITGITDYAAEAPLNTFYSSEDELMRIFSKMEKRGRDEAIIKFSERFYWENIYKQLEAYYKRILQK